MYLINVENNIKIDLQKNLIKIFILSMLLYESKNRTIYNEMQKQLEAF